MSSPGEEDFSGFSQGDEARPGRAERDSLIRQLQLEVETRRESVALAQAGPRLEESIGPEVRKSN